MEYLSYHLPPDIVGDYHNRKPPFGFHIGAGNTLGELTFLAKYSRVKWDGTKERWYETCERVVNGYMSILKDHCRRNNLPWVDAHADSIAIDAYDRLFNLKWTPPGRGLWMMGTEFVHERQSSAALQNCAFLSTARTDDPVLPYVRLMEMSMLGIGVGFDTDGEGSLTITAPAEPARHIVIGDNREGWCAATRVLLESYLAGGRRAEFDYDRIRPAGEPIRGFGGVAAGPEPLMRLHKQLRELFDGREGERITSTDIVDVMNMIGKCVVAGNVRRSAEIALGRQADTEFIALKDYERNPDRMGPDGWGYTSNNSIYASATMPLSKDIIEQIERTGEPGLFYVDLARSYGRLADEPNSADWRAQGTNPCGEQTLENHECCTLVETFPIRHENLTDYLDTLKHAYMYAKAVTLMPTHWPETNAVMQRNRRIGCSMSGVAQFVDVHGWSELKQWMDRSYVSVQRRDREFSEWLGVRESIKTTSIKPSGTVSLLAGVAPGVHWPTADFYIRRMRYRKDDELLPILEAAGYHVEPDVMDPDWTRVVELPTTGVVVRTQDEVSLWEKARLAALAQRWWADNQVSVTLTFRPDEAEQVGPVIDAYSSELKAMSFLPSVPGAYQQMPYEWSTEDHIYSRQLEVDELDWDALYGSGREAEGELYCTTDACEIRTAA